MTFALVLQQGCVNALMYIFVCFCQRIKQRACTRAFDVGSRIAMLYEGSIRQVGTVEEIRRSTDPVVRQFIEGRPNLDDSSAAAD